MKFFGTDGIRGIPNEKLTIELMVQIGQALTCLNNDTVCIATDTRHSKILLASGIIGGCLSRGMKVIYLGIMPTPALIYYASIKKSIGVMITASHNPYSDNGIKILNKGQKLNKEEEKRLEEEITNPNNGIYEVGTFERKDISKEYMDFILKFVEATPFKIAIDCAHGATYRLAPLIFEKMCKELIVIGNYPNGKNINLDCGSTHLEGLKKIVVNHQCDLGFAFDGDGDRILAVDRYGNVISGDEIIYIIAKYLKEENSLNHNQVVLSKMSNQGIINAFHKLGIEVLETEVGDKYIKEALDQYDISIGGENSGHIIVPKYFHTGDGMLVGLLLMHILNKQNMEAHQALEEVILYEDRLVNLKVSNKDLVLNDMRLKEEIEKIKQELNGDCKIIVRASGTEDLIRVTVMTKRKEQASFYSQKLCDLIEEIDNE